MRASRRLAGLALIAATLAAPAAAQAPAYRTVPPPQQAPLPWHVQTAPQGNAGAAQGGAPNLDQNYRRLQQSRQNQEGAEQRNLRNARRAIRAGNR